MTMFEHDTDRDVALIKRALAGRSEAWDQLIEIYAPLIHSIPVRHGLAATDVEDVAQDTFAALAQNLHQLENPAALPAWLMTTARRLSWRAVQKSKRDSVLDEDALTSLAEKDQPRLFSGSMPSMNELLEQWQNQEMLTKGFQALGDRCRQLLSLIFLDDNEPSYEEISQQLGISKGSIGPTRNRCLTQLRDILLGLGYHQ